MVIKTAVRHQLRSILHCWDPSLNPLTLLVMIHDLNTAAFVDTSIDISGPESSNCTCKLAAHQLLRIHLALYITELLIVQKFCGNHQQFTKVNNLIGSTCSVLKRNQKVSATLYMPSASTFLQYKILTCAGTKYHQFHCYCYTRTSAAVCQRST